jgi:hypothetical protein
MKIKRVNYITVQNDAGEALIHGCLIRSLGNKVADSGVQANINLARKQVFAQQCLRLIDVYTAFDSESVELVITKLGGNYEGRTK